MPKAVKLLPSSLEEEYLVASLVALMTVLWLSWFSSSAGAAQGDCSELACRKVFTAKCSH